LRPEDRDDDANGDEYDQPERDHADILASPFGPAERPAGRIT
jgi:hypothetical protein